MHDSRPARPGTLAVAFAMSIAACGLSATQVRERELCYERAEAAAQRRVDAECPEGFSACSVRDDIMDELRRNQEACP